MADINTSLVFVGDFITATATDTSNSTSEFGENFEVTTMQALGCRADSILFHKNPTDVYSLDLFDGSTTLLETNPFT